MRQNILNMKKIVLIVSLLALFSLNGIAQRGTRDFGLKIGPNFNWVGSSSTADKNLGTRLGFGLGAFVDNYFTDRMALSIGLNFNLTRLHYQFTDYRLVENFLTPSIVSVNRRFKGGYIELPVKVKVKFPVVDSWNAFAEAGGGIGVNLSARGKDVYDYYGISFGDSHYTDCSSDYRLLQFALHFGLGVEYELSSKIDLFAQLTSRNSLSNMFTRELKNLTGSNLKAYFIGIEIGIMY